MTYYILTIDFGSTYTKGVLLDREKEVVISQATVNTYSKANLLESYQELNGALAQKLKIDKLKIDQTLICSSAFGGFKMVAIGLTNSLTADAARKVALGAGTRILKTYAYALSFEDIQEINTLKPDVILLTGGVNGGNTSFILMCAQRLTALEDDIPIIVAGNSLAIPELKKILSQRNYVISENVLPKVNCLQTTKTRQLLRRIFFDKIIYAKGLEEIAKLSDSPIIPTPMAVLEAAKLLSEGTSYEDGIGSVAIVDIGGATTDVHSASNGVTAEEDVLYEGLPEPFLKRTVEGDLGMRYSAVSLMETAGIASFSDFSGQAYDERQIRQFCLKREQTPEFIPASIVERDFDCLMAKVATRIAVKRHAGTIRRERHPHHDTYYQKGKDLRHLSALIGTGGVMIHSGQAREILEAALQKEQEHLMPKTPQLYIDGSYLLSSLGLLSEQYPCVALRMLKKSLIPL